MNERWCSFILLSTFKDGKDLSKCSFAYSLTSVLAVAGCYFRLTATSFALIFPRLFAEHLFNVTTNNSNRNARLFLILSKGNTRCFRVLNAYTSLVRSAGDCSGVCKRSLRFTFQCLLLAVCFEEIVFMFNFSHIYTSLLFLASLFLQVCSEMLLTHLVTLWFKDDN